MLDTVAIWISTASFLVSVGALLRRGRTGVPGPAGKDGKNGVSALPGLTVSSRLSVPAVQPALDPTHRACEVCHRVVARYNELGVCVNCSPSK